MPPTASRPSPVELWLCGHHYRVSRQALAAAQASCYPLTAPADSQPAAATMTPAR